MTSYIALPHGFWRYPLTTTDRVVYVALKSYANRLGYCSVKHANVAARCGLSVATVARAIQRLHISGLVSIRKRYDRQGQLIANGYYFAAIPGRFSKVPTDIWRYNLPKSTFVVYLFLLHCRTEKSLEAVPSLSQMVSALHMSKRTLVDAISALSSCWLLHKTRYVRQQDGRFGHNRYLVLTNALRKCLTALLSFLPGKKEQRSTLSNRVDRLAQKECPNSTYRIAHVATKVKSFLCSRAFLLRSFTSFCHKWVGTILIRQ